jgi:hypothetical protein
MEKAKQTNQQAETPKVSLSRRPSRFVGVFRLLRLRTAGFQVWQLSRTWREGVLAIKTDSRNFQR